MNYKIETTRRGRPAVLPYLYSSLLLGLFACIWSITFDGNQVAAEDGPAYYILGKALYLGEGYTYINMPDAVPANNPPPGYPALIALIMALWSADFGVIKAVNGIFLMLSILLLFSLFTRLSHRVHLAFVAALAVLCNAHLLNKSMVMMSEPSFLFFSTAALLLFTRLQGEDFKQPQLYLLLVCLLVSFYTRTMGMALLAAVCLELVWQRRWKYLAFIATGCVVAALPWYLRGRRLGGNVYIDQLLSINPYRPELGMADWRDLVVRFYENVLRYIYREIPDAVLYHINPVWTTGPTLSDWLVGFLFIALAGCGLYQLQAHRRLIVVYVAATGGIILLWPQVWTGTRFLQPLIPLLLLAVFNGLYAVFVWGAKKVGSPWRFHPLVLLLFLLIYIPDMQYLYRQATQARVPNNWVNYFTMAEWVAQNTETEAIVACRKPLLFYLYSNRRTVIYKFTDDKMLLLDDLRQNRVDYVVVDRLGYSSTIRYLVPAVQAHVEMFSVIHTIKDPDTWLVKYHPSD